MNKLQEPSAVTEVAYSLCSSVRGSESKGVMHLIEDTYDQVDFDFYRLAKSPEILPEGFSYMAGADEISFHLLQFD